MLSRFTLPAQQLHSSSPCYASWHLPAPRLHPGCCQAGTSVRPGLAPIAKLENVEPSAPLADRARLEAILLLAHEPLSSRKLSQYANLADGTQARTLIRQLNEHYDGAGRAFRVEHVAGGYQLLTRRKFAPWLRRLAHVPAETRLSAPALETLAVIAYRQPVLRADIEAIRGVNCEEILRQLMERNLVRIDGRSQELGRPFLYSTTKQFLQLYGLANLNELPAAGDLRAHSIANSPPAELAPHSPEANAAELAVTNEPEPDAIDY